MPKHWSNQDIERLRSLAQTRKAADIAAELGRTPGSLAVKAHQLGISLRVGQRNSPEQSKVSDINSDVKTRP